MRAALVLLAAAVVGLVLQSAAATELPAYAVPDLGLLVAVTAALLLGPAEGLLVAAGAGFGADVLSGSLLGQHALLRLLEYALVRALGAQLDLLRAGPFAALALGLSLLDAAGLAGLSGLFLGGGPPLPGALAPLAARAAVNAAAAVPILAGLRALVERARADRAHAGRAVRFERRRAGP